MSDYSYEIGEEVTFLDEAGSGFVASFKGDGIVMVTTEDGFDMPYPIGQLVPRFDLREARAKLDMESDSAREKFKEVPKGPILNMDGYSLGMKVYLSDRDESGVILQFFEDRRVELELEDLFTMRVPIDQITLTSTRQVKQINASMDQVTMQDIGENVRKVDYQKSLKDRKDSGVWEVDLHIQELVDNSHGMMKHAIVQLQLDTFDKKLNEAIDRGMHKVIFIHGRGEGRLRNAIREILKRYPNCESLDADYKRYGIGATEVRVKYRPVQVD